MSKMDFWIRRIHSITGVIPIGAFLMEHMYSVSTIMRGPAAFNHTVSELASMPFLVPIEITAIGLPIAFHAILGLIYAFKAQNNPLRYGYWNNRMFYLQRITAYITFIFIAWHVWTLRIMGKAIGGHLMTYYYLHQILSNPVTFVLYVIGILAAVFHFTNGLWGFAITWGIAVGPRAQRLVGLATLALFVVISSVGLTALTHFAK
jgi:succinate dehydrogenase / fumarate reductase cytochrome b subunit